MGRHTSFFLFFFLFPPPRQRERLFKCLYFRPCLQVTKPDLQSVEPGLLGFVVLLYFPFFQQFLQDK